MGLQAHAAALTYNFTGTISQFSTDVAMFDGIAYGDTFAGTFTYDPAATSATGSTAIGQFDALGHLEASVHGFKLTSDTLAGAIDTDLYHLPGTYDRLDFSTYPGFYRDALTSNSGSSVCGGTCAPYYMQLVLADYSTSTFSTAATLPSTLTLSSFTVTNFYFNWLTPAPASSQLLAGGHLTSLTHGVAAVPEPSTCALLALGLAFSSASLRRRLPSQR